MEIKQVGYAFYELAQPGVPPIIVRIEAYYIFTPRTVNGEIENEIKLDQVRLFAPAYDGEYGKTNYHVEIDESYFPVWQQKEISRLVETECLEFATDLVERLQDAQAEQREELTSRGNV